MWVELFVLSLLQPPLAGDAFRRPPAWQALASGIEYAALSATTPRPQQAHALRLDLTRPGLEFLATPAAGDGRSETRGLVTSHFLTKHGCRAAINAAPFGPVVPLENLPQNVAGLQVSRGRIVSCAEGNYPALLITKDNRARIADSPFDLSDTWTAVGGFQIVLADGSVKNGGADLHPRTGAGLSADGRTMIWLVIDGRQKGFSDGVTTGEVGAWLKELGCADGINLDGGGTTTLAVADGAKAKVLNRPIHAGVPGRERPSASHLGVIVRP